MNAKLDQPDSKVHDAKMGPPGSCRPQMGPMLAQWTLLSGQYFHKPVQAEKLYINKSWSHIDTLILHATQKFPSSIYNTLQPKTGISWHPIVPINQS